MIRNVIAMLAFAVSMSACVAPQYVQFTQENAKKVQKVTARSVVIQDEVIAKADPSVAVSAALGGGLIGALVDASITRARQERLQTAMEKFYESVDDYDFRSEYWSQVSRHLKEQFPLKVTSITTTPRFDINVTKKIVQDLGPDEAYLSLFTEYYLSTDLRSVNVNTGVNLFMKGEPPVVIYRNTVTYQSPPVGNGGEESAKAWAADNGKLLYEKLKEGMTETLALLSIDLKNQTPAAANAEKINVKFNYGEGAGDRKTMEGTLVEKRGDRVVIRNAAGKLYSLLP
jgi:hypothetical protein